MKLHGVDGLMRNLRAAQASLNDRAQRRILLNAGEIVARRARDLAPVQTGTLRDSIHVSFARPDEMSFSIRDSGVRVFIGPSADVFYAPYIEFGTWKRQAHPFMRPAFDQTEDEVRRALAQGIWSTIKASI